MQKSLFPNRIPSSFATLRETSVAILWRAVQVWFYYLTWLVSLFVNNAVSRYKIVGSSPPLRGPVLITMNHISMWDLAIFFTPMRRPFRYVTKAELFNVPFVGGLLWMLGCFPINRGKADRQALQTAIGFLKQGQMVGICPEGHRSPDHTLQLAHSGVALLALNAPPGTKIVPVAVWGTEVIWQEKKGRFMSHRPPVTVRVGQPYEITRQIDAHGKSKRPDLEAVTEQIMVKIAELMPPQYQGAYSPAAIANRQQEKIYGK